ncbi:alkyl/aryl-sulfatase [Streptomyces olivochromogenes]|uniref:Beta-lactamase-like protein n=1 Tax=Streptomyces olivochromogenes TaxID=1963 RepID=A0A250VQG5_STROL|nr:alkyl sulfatase dimerization domain-containing protein [Streptomyces olivochromogenes]KUN39487.1 alkyl sulfatase [Streptomyces olivochromogenes]GAX56319.1 beta-lactamase-like protein [Streptomyces olivochromogenes]
MTVPARDDLPFDDLTDFENADRGFIAALDPPVITDAEAQIVYDGNAYAFLDEDCPDTAHPSLWRQSQLCARHGLYEVTEGVYQVRGLDLSNMTLVEGKHGVIVIDPLISAECAAAALGLYHEHRGSRPVTGLVYTHSHVDHFGGARGVVARGSESGLPVLAPEGFLEHAVSESVFAGNAMLRRSAFMYGSRLPRAPRGQIGTGLGTITSTGTVTLIAPNVDITRTGQEETIDGVRFVFQLTPGTEAPAEMNFLLPEQRALCVAENASHTLHNVLTLRGAPVRDAHEWARYLDETIDVFGDTYDVAFASHHWPIWGRANIVRFLGEQRDLYAYLHDQTLRMLNRGLTGTEIAEELLLPPALESAWHARGYYGSVSHNVKAVYQRYMGWYDGNPAHLWEHPPVELGRRYVELAGGQTETLVKARAYIDAGDLRFAATLLNHLVFADPSNNAAKDTLAGVYERLGYGAENGTWRNAYLTAALELRAGTADIPVDTTSPELTSALTVGMLLDSLAVRIEGPRAWNEHLTLDLVIIDEQRRHRVNLHNGALTHRAMPVHHTPKPHADLTLTLTRPELLGVVSGRGLAGIESDGDTTVLARLLSYVSEPDKAFPIVTP